MAIFTIRGHSHEVDAEEVRRAIRGQRPEPVVKYSVEIDGQRYPIKQVIEIACNVPRVSFTSMDAFRILDKLGFNINSG